MDDGSGASGRTEDDTGGGQGTVVVDDTVRVSYSVSLQLGHRKTERERGGRMREMDEYNVHHS